MNTLTQKIRIGNPRQARSPGEELDRELARGMLDGSRQSLSHFVDRHLGPLTHYLERRLGIDDGRRTTDDDRPETPQSSDDSATPDDPIQQIVQATFRDAFHHLKPYANGTTHMPMRLWLIRRAERNIRKFRSQKSKLKSQNSKLPDRGSLDWLRPIIRGLPRRQEVALCLALFEKFTPEEMGHAMGVRPARAMRLLRGALLKVNKQVIAQEGLDE